MSEARSEQDRRRLYQSQRDLAASEALIALAPDAARAYLELLIADLRSAHNGLRDAVAALLTEHSESDAARLAFLHLLDLGARYYAYIRRQARSALLDLDPITAASLSADELTRRQRLFDRAFAQSPSVLARWGSGRQVTILGEAADTLEASAELSAVVDVAALRDLHTQLTDASAALQREQREDSDAQRALAVSRDVYDRAASAYADLVRSLLTHLQRSHELGRYLTLADPAYRARLTRRRPLSEEPDIDAIEDALGLNISDGVTDDMTDALTLSDDVAASSDDASTP